MSLDMPPRGRPVVPPSFHHSYSLKDALINGEHQAITVSQTVNLVIRTEKNSGPTPETLSGNKREHYPIMEIQRGVDVLHHLDLHHFLPSRMKTPPCKYEVTWDRSSKSLGFRYEDNEAAMGRRKYRPGQGLETCSWRLFFIFIDTCDCFRAVEILKGLGLSCTKEVSRGILPRPTTFPPSTLERHGPPKPDSSKEFPRSVISPQLQARGGFKPRHEAMRCYSPLNPTSRFQIADDPSTRQWNRTPTPNHGQHSSSSYLDAQLPLSQEEYHLHQEISVPSSAKSPQREISGSPHVTPAFAYSNYSRPEAFERFSSLRSRSPGDFLSNSSQMADTRRESGRPVLADIQDFLPPPRTLPFSSAEHTSPGSQSLSQQPSVSMGEASPPDVFDRERERSKEPEEDAAQLPNVQGAESTQPPGRRVMKRRRPENFVTAPSASKRQLTARMIEPGKSRHNASVDTSVVHAAGRVQGDSHPDIRPSNELGTDGPSTSQSSNAQAGSRSIDPAEYASATLCLADTSIDIFDEMMDECEGATGAIVEVHQEATWLSAGYGLEWVRRLHENIEMYINRRWR